MIRSLCRISLNGLCGRRTGTTEWRRRVVEEEEEEGESWEEDKGGKLLDTLTREKYVELKQQEGMPSTPLDVFLALPQKRENREGKRCLSHNLSHLCTHSKHIIRIPCQPVIPQGHAAAPSLCVSCCLSPSL